MTLMPFKAKHKKRVRLKNFAYKGAYRYFITLCTRDKRAVFNDQELVSWLIDVLREKSSSLGFRVWAYCFMPDHVHLLIEGVNCESDMRKFVSSYKQATGFHYKKNHEQALWHINFHEHVLRKEESAREVARYIFDNPVRKGLAENFKQYAFSGSFEFDVSEL